MAKEADRKLVPISQEELDSAYGCNCINCKKSGPVRAYRCCFKDCYSFIKGGWTSFISTSR